MRMAMGALVIVCTATACGARLIDPSPVSASCNPTALSASAAMPLFVRPFAGDYPVGNFFDHEKPVDNDTNGYVLTLCGARDSNQVDGHPGYDFRMPEGTRLAAVADGIVFFAGLESPRYCAPLNRTVQALLVEIEHRAPSGEPFISVYGHLSRVDVERGASVAEGAAIGLSGNTGCSGTPHLHFAAARAGTDGNYRLIDPYGWHAASPDPWETDPSGAASVWLWKDGAAPALR
jgi:murein DD-endopeptidase MepM/ murein hydrolase activator NlpD